MSSEFTYEKFKSFIAQGKFMTAKCGKCNRILLPPKPVCPYCGSREISWIEIPRVGRIVSYTEIHVPPRGFEKLAPYIVALVEFEGGVKLPGVVKDAKISDLKIGLNVLLDFSSDSPSGYFFTITPALGAA
ncbi:MAG: Zn-ribbon domain-containing OB-fold protein [archaeon YNP-LCB-024-027]|nr:Zn-ribbon domain-containing OB-fold protein [Candidatus Culexarchaeum yellowstonense]